MADEIFDVIMRVEGEDDVKRLTKEMMAAEAAAVKLAGVLKGQGVSAAGIASDQGMRLYGQQINDIGKQLKTAEDQVLKFGGSAASSSGKAGQALMQLGYAVDDVQYGFRGIANNIQPLGYSILGAFKIESAMAWSGAIGIAAIAAYQLYLHWDELTSLMGQDRIKTEAEQMELLGKKTKLTADEFDRLARYKAVDKKVDELRSGKTESEKKAEDIATTTLIEADPKRVAQGILATAPELLDTDVAVVAAKKKLDDARNSKFENVSPEIGAIAGAADNTEAVAEARQGLIDARRNAAERHAAMGTLPQLFQNGIQGLGDLVKQNPGKFGEHEGILASGLEEAQRQNAMTPESRQQDKMEKAVGKTWESFTKGFDRAVEKQIGQNSKDELAAADYENEVLDESNKSWMKRKDEKNKKAKADAKSAASKAKEDSPGLDAALGSYVEGSLKEGMDPEALKAQIAESLTEKFGADAANEMAGDAVGKGKKSLISDMLKGGKDEQKSTSSTIGGADFAKQIQSGIGGEDKALTESKKHTDELQASKLLLRQLVAQGKTGTGVRPK